MLLGDMCDPRQVRLGGLMQMVPGAEGGPPPGALSRQDGWIHPELALLLGGAAWGQGGSKEPARLCSCPGCPAQALRLGESGGRGRRPRQVRR